MPLVLLVFYGDFLRIPLEFCCPPADFQTWKFLRFFAFDFPKAAEALAFSASSRVPHLPSNSAEFGNPGHTRNRFVGDEPARGFESHRLRQQRDAAPRTRTSPLWSARIFMPALVPGIYFASVPHRKPHSIVLDAVFLLPIYFSCFGSSYRAIASTWKIETRKEPGLEIALGLCYNQCVV